MSRLIASVLFVGYLRPAPGTWGSLAALPLAWALHALGGPVALALGAGVLFWAGLSATGALTTGAADHDPSWIVIDEVVGQWVALLPVSIGAWHAGVPLTKLWPGILVAFVAFRLFDIWKPWLVGRADARGDAWGVMMDDVWAGVFAALVGVALAAIAHGWLRP